MRLHWEFYSLCTRAWTHYRYSIDRGQVSGYCSSFGCLKLIETRSPKKIHLLSIPFSTFTYLFWSLCSLKDSWWYLVYWKLFPPPFQQVLFCTKWSGLQLSFDGAKRSHRWHWTTFKFLNLQLYTPEQSFFPLSYAKIMILTPISNG